jgi:outer membrane protein
MKKNLKRCLYFLLASYMASAAHASDLIDVYRHSLENDPIFKAAYSTYMANAEAIPQARSALLPQVTLGAQATQNMFNTDVAGTDGLNGTEVYKSNQWRLNASQAIFNYQAWAQVQKAKASVKAANATFNNAAQDLILRTAKAYFDVLLARDTLSFVEAKKRANKRQLEQAQQRFNVGLEAITSVYEAQAAYDQSVADVIKAKNNQINQNENLRKLTNHTYDYLAPLRNSKIPLIKPEPNNVDDWIAAGLRQNYNLFTAKYNLEAARENIKAQSAGNWPTIALQGSGVQTHNYGNDESNFFVPDQQFTANVGITINFPVFQGGLVQANTKQAQYNFQTFSEQLEQAYRNVTVNSSIAFNTIKDGISKVTADRQAVVSRQNSLESTDAQFQAGTRTMVDVVNAQQRLFEAQEQLASDQYGLILAILNLKYLAGSLSVSDLEEINSWLNIKLIRGLPPQPKALAKTTCHHCAVKPRL